MDKNVTEQLDNLYGRYGYEIKKALTKNDVRVYALSKGVYFGADIVSLSLNQEDVVKAQDTLSKAGFGCRVINFTNIIEVESKLFEAFFRSSTLKERLQERYKKFASTQSELLKVQYQYINAPYLLESEHHTNKDSDIITSVLETLNEEGPTLLIIEASAGFGKTCTSYELINHISLSEKALSPIFTELSRDRRAAIFKHILDDVIINEFHSLLDENLVIHEIQSGRIPLIIDGFDELLSKEQDLGTDDFEQVETMLSTIGDLLSGNAKIILTGRKTAIFSGDSFQDWIANNPNEFKVFRFLINPPRIKDWLSETQIEKISNKNIPIKEIANPVLLAFMRSLNGIDFDEIIENPSTLVEKYFQAILDREQERQDLRIEPLYQLEIYKKLAKRMMEFDITSDTKEWIKQLLEEQNRSYLEEVRKSYPVAQRPTLDEITNTLSNHALLDRKGANDNIGFINDFIFGTFLGDAIVELDIKNLKDISKHMFELASTAFQFQGIDKQSRLLERLKSLTIFSPQERLLHEYLLGLEIVDVYDGATFSDFSLTSAEFIQQDQFIGCVFANCTFNDSCFSINSFPNSSFVNCVFKNCTLSNEKNQGTGLMLINCTDYDSGFINSAKLNESFREDNSNSDLLTVIKNKVISLYFKKGNSRPRYRKMSLLISAFSTADRELVSEILEDLQQQQLIKVNGDNSFLTDEGIKLGQEILLSV